MSTSYTDACIAYANDLNAVSDGIVGYPSQDPKSCSCCYGILIDPPISPAALAQKTLVTNQNVILDPKLQSVLSLNFIKADYRTMGSTEYDMFKMLLQGFISDLLNGMGYMPNCQIIDISQNEIPYGYTSTLLVTYKTGDASTITSNLVTFLNGITDSASVSNIYHRVNLAFLNHEGVLGFIASDITLQML
jgi:hypothetical protein